MNRLIPALLTAALITFSFDLVHAADRVVVVGATSKTGIASIRLAQGNDIVPIPGTRRIDRLEENLGALDVTLTNDDLAAIETASPADAVSGTRYPEAAMAGVNL